MNAIMKKVDRIYLEVPTLRKRKAAVFLVTDLSTISDIAMERRLDTYVWS